MEFHSEHFPESFPRPRLPVVMYQSILAGISRALSTRSEFDPDISRKSGTKLLRLWTNSDDVDSVYLVSARCFESSVTWTFTTNFEAAAEIAGFRVIHLLMMLINRYPRLPYLRVALRNCNISSIDCPLGNLPQPPCVRAPYIFRARGLRRKSITLQRRTEDAGRLYCGALVRSRPDYMRRVPNTFYVHDTSLVVFSTCSNGRVTGALALRLILPSDETDSSLGPDCHTDFE